MITRKTTCEILDLVDEGVLNALDVLQAALMWMSEDEVADMARANEFLTDDEGEEE